MYSPSRIFIRAPARMSPSKTVRLNSGHEMPLIGMGTYQMKDEEVLFKALDTGLEVGYRLIDTAACYKNEALIGKALKVLLPKHGLTRKDIFVTSKLWCRDHGAGKAREGALKSLEDLQLDYLDLYLIHWPGVMSQPSEDNTNSQKRKESWEELEKLLEEGRFKSIGVSNYLPVHLKELEAHAKISPAVNQCEYHPLHATQDLVDYYKGKGIHFQAYSSFGSPKGVTDLFEDFVVKKIATEHNASPAQVLLAFALNQGISVLPRSTKPEHVKENFKSSSVILSKEEIANLSRMQKKYCWDPSVIA